MAKLSSAFVGVDGFEIIPIDSGIIARVRVWNNTTLVVDRVEVVDGSENVPGVHTLVQEEDPDNPGNFYLALPAYLSYAYNIEVPVS
jgi:hypothetical protein